MGCFQTSDYVTNVTYLKMPKICWNRLVKSCVVRDVCMWHNDPLVHDVVVFFFADIYFVYLLERFLFCFLFHIFHRYALGTSMTQEGALALQEKIGNCKVLFEKRYNSALRNDYDPTSYGEIHHFFYFYPHYRHLSVSATTAGLADNTAILNQTESTRWPCNIHGKDPHFPVCC